MAERGATWLLGVAVLAVLLYFDPDPLAFAAPKSAALLLLAALALPWLATRSPVGSDRAGLPETAPRRRLDTLAGGAVLASLLALGVLLAPDPAAALWGRPPRAEGVALAVAVLMLGLLARQLTPTGMTGLDRMLHIGGALMALSVLAGVFRLPLPGLPGGFDDGHGGTLGNPNTAGAVLAALLVHATARGGGWRWLLPLYAAALFGTGSKAAWLAMLVGVAWLVPSAALRRLALGLLAAGGIAVMTALSLRAEPAPSAALRLELWGAALRALAPIERAEDPLGHWRWLLGYGPEQQAELLERHRRPPQNAWEAGGHERAADRAHSLPLDLWLSFGVAGLALLLWMLRRVLQASSAAAAAALTLLVAGLVGFYGPAEWLLLALWLARLRPVAAMTPAASRPRMLLSLLLFGALAALLWRGNPAADDHARRLQLEAEYRRLASTSSESMAALQALAEQACRRADRRLQDGDAALLCAQIALAAGLPAARIAALRATALRPARPRAWLLRLLTAPEAPEIAWAGFRAALAPTPLDPATASAWAAALDQAAVRQPALKTLPAWAATLQPLREGRGLPAAVTP